MDKSHPKTRLATRVRTGGVFAILFTALAPHMARCAAGQEVTEHPYIKTSEIRSQTCLTCHPGKTEGKFVHSAIKLGCQQCHRVSSEDQTTTVTLPKSGGELCAKCHEIEQSPMTHGPYKSGECLVCHNPHSSDFPAHTRAPANTLCLSCHGVNQPDVKIDSDSKTVSLLGGRTIPADVYKTAPKVDEGHHPDEATPALGQSSPGRQGQSRETLGDCLSCHEAHGGEARWFLRPAK
jgi:predicted CXXCH cytochrome family protein